MQNSTPDQPVFTTTARKRFSFFRSLLSLLLLAAVFGGGVFYGANNSDRLPWQKDRPVNSRLPAGLSYDSVNKVYNVLRDKYDGNLDKQTVIDGLKHGLAGSTGDPYTEYFTVKEAKSFSDDLQGTLTGIGAKLEQDDEGNIVIVAPLAGSPAEAAGIRARDVIVKVDDTATIGMTATEAVLKIRGEKGTTVKLGIVRDKKQVLEFTITRDVIKVPTATSKTLDGGIGYLQVSQFSDDTDELVAKAAAGFKEAGVKGIVLDLRDNPGGEITTAVNLSSLWLQRGDKVVEQRRDKKVIDTSYATGSGTLRGIPTVVLVNAGSASASEITALALRDYGAATIIGEKTYGKGVVQELVPFSDGSALKVTVAKWYSPKGTNIDKKGVEPDQAVKMTEDDYKSQNDTQLNAAVERLSAPR